MKRLLIVFASALMLSSMTGCLQHVTKGGVEGCRTGGCGMGGCATGGCAMGGCATGGCGVGGCAAGACTVPGSYGGLVGAIHSGQLAEGLRQACSWHHERPQLAPEGPPTATTAYPYYTLRGPRDFLVNNPPSIGN